MKTRINKKRKPSKTKSNVDSDFIAFQAQLESYLYRLSANKEDAKDLVQETYIRVKQKFDTFKGNSTFKTWCFSIATNLARDNQRVKNRWKLEVQDDCKNASLSIPKHQQKIISAFENQAEQQFEIAEHINYCFTCIAKNLNLEEQIAVILKEFYQFGRAEIAEILGKTEGVIKHLLFNGRKELQIKYEQRCALINKKGVCYQCAELNDFLQVKPNSQEKIKKLKLKERNNSETNLDFRFNLINQINPLNSKASELEDTILQILREVIDDK
ncbi:sigma-70 family RNA polymerase sigma factor [Maribacter algarum]|uniref:Sigma-70 family RNA polymerase sigma factor n=1 Tax=Maribacter algarum (ex Zhang et al. 2020) TaxID=2578118 RepID=A0A5S3PS52_9FLAO|nr:sigma-70 family RNA polymerase sigma factor [Maribacter algarum]TMM57459.1 sigma-70 family RNA polymerase sigma factor [Maribacter algarum]